jgi:hypothetical protein
LINPAKGHMVAFEAIRTSLIRCKRVPSSSWLRLDWKLVSLSKPVFDLRVKLLR